jgi:hypothetical protein
MTGTDRSFLFRMGVLSSQMLMALRPGHSLSAKEKKIFVEMDEVLARLADVHRYLTQQTFRRETKTIEGYIVEYTLMREVIKNNAWRFNDATCACFDGLLPPLRARLKGEPDRMEDLDEARAFFTAMSASVLGAFPESEPDDED